jgi:Na+/melibiose symporter-like transporter
VAEPLRISLMRPPNHADHLVTALPRNVLAAGLVSFFTDLSSEMIVPVLPIFLTAVLGAPVAAVGLIEGVAESTASIVRVFAGSISDRAGHRKPLMLVGTWPLRAAGLHRSR